MLSIVNMIFQERSTDFMLASTIKVKVESEHLFGLSLAF